MNLSFQSTLSRRERHMRSQNILVRARISIHALTKRATSLAKISPDGSLISIHALTKRATIDLLAKQSATRHFNPRSHEESDCKDCTTHQTADGFQSTLSRRERHLTTGERLTKTGISIHALTKRATNGRLI